MSQQKPIQPPKYRKFKHRAAFIFLLGLGLGTSIFIVLSFPHPANSSWRTRFFESMLELMSPLGWGMLFFLLLIGAGLLGEITDWHFQDLPEEWYDEQND